jgi:hypothetical protein
MCSQAGRVRLRITQHLTKTTESNIRRTDLKAISESLCAYNAERASVQTAPERSRIDSRFRRRRDLHGLEERARGFRVLTIAAGWWDAPSLGWARRDARVKTICVRPCITDQKHFSAEVMRRIRGQRTYANLPLTSDRPQLRNFLTPTFSARMGKEASSKYEGVCLKRANASHRSRGRRAPALT